MQLAAGAQDEYLWSGPETASYNTVNPNFTNISLSDQWRPSDRWLVNAALRYESYTYDMAHTGTEAEQFYASDRCKQLLLRHAWSNAGRCCTNAGHVHAPVAARAIPPAITDRDP